MGSVEVFTEEVIPSNDDYSDAFLKVLDEELKEIVIRVTLRQRDYRRPTLRVDQIKPYPNHILSAELEINAPTTP